MATTITPKTAGPSRTVLFVVGAILVAAACGLGALIYFRTEPFAIDEWWNALLFSSPVAFLTGFSRVMNFLGAGWFGVLVVPILGAIGLILLKRPWSAAFFLTAQAASAGAVQVLKHLFGRARPEEIIVISDYGSFPSGHVAGAATLAMAAFILFPRLWVALVGIAWVLLMALSRTALHAHWLTDTIGGALIGAGMVLIVAGIFAPLLRRERPDAAIPASRVTTAPH
ncbi:MAG: phosphatase PAP2 family protein [Microbacterium sp.]